MFIPKGDWTDKGHGCVVTTQFQADDYREFLLASWPEFPFAAMKELVTRRRWIALLFKKIRFLF